MAITNDSSQTDLASIDAVVQQALVQLRGVYSIVPDLRPTPPEGLKVFRFARGITDEFLEAGAVAAQNDATMQAVTGLDPVRTRMVINRNLRFEPLAAAAEALARDIRYNMFRERWDVVQQALQVYNLAKGYTRNTRGASLVAHVKTMQNALGRTGRSRKTKSPAPAPATPPPAPAPKQQ